MRYFLVRNSKILFVRLEALWVKIKDGKEKQKEYMESAVIFSLTVMTVSM